MNYLQTPRRCSTLLEDDLPTRPDRTHQAYDLTSGNLESKVQAIYNVMYLQEYSVDFVRRLSMN